VGDVTTLANPDVVEQIRDMVQGKEAVVSKERDSGRPRAVWAE